MWCREGDLFNDEGQPFSRCRRILGSGFLEYMRSICCRCCRQGAAQIDLRMDLLTIIGQVQADANLGGTVLITQKSVVDALMEHAIHAVGCCPTVFHSATISIQDSCGAWYEVYITVLENKELQQQATQEGHIPSDNSAVTRVIGYDCAGVHAGVRHGRHCVFLEKLDPDTHEWIGHNSWGDRQQNPRIPVHNAGTQIWDVKIRKMKKLKAKKGSTGQYSFRDDIYRAIPVSLQSKFNVKYL